MDLQPKIIDHPGAGKIQEMSLDQYVSALSPDHYARRQLDELRAQALKAVEFFAQLLEANQKIMDLQNKLILGIPAQSIVPGPNYFSSSSDLLGLTGAVTQKSAQEQAIKAGIVSAPPAPISLKKKVPLKKPAQCPNCGKMVSTYGGPWANHQKTAHPNNPAPIPPALPRGL